jgi:hypothetical protein
MQLAIVDTSSESAENESQDALQEAPVMPSTTVLPPAPKPANTPILSPASGSCEQHKWKLADGVWAEITITGRLDANGFDKLKKYVALIDVSSDASKAAEDSERKQPPTGS